MNGKVSFYRRKLAACALKSAEIPSATDEKFNFTNRGNKVFSDDEGNHSLHRKKKVMEMMGKNYLNSDP